MHSARIWKSRANNQFSLPTLFFVLFYLLPPRRQTQWNRCVVCISDPCFVLLSASAAVTALCQNLRYPVGRALGHAVVRCATPLFYPYRVLRPLWGTDYFAYCRQTRFTPSYFIRLGSVHQSALSAETHTLNYVRTTLDGHTNRT